VTANSAAPTGLRATPGNAQISLSWTGSAGATSFNVYRGTSSGGESATPLANGITTTSYTDNSVSNGTTYYYEVAAVNSSGVSGMSNEASARPFSALQSSTVGDIDCGSLTSPFTILDTIDNIIPSGTIFGVDSGFTGGSATPAPQTITWPDDPGGHDIPLLTTERVGGSFSYSLPLPSGSYELGLYFADITGDSAGTNVFNVQINGTTVLQNFDIVARAGNYTGMEQFIPFLVNNPRNSTNTTITFTATSGQASVAAISISQYIAIPTEQRIANVGSNPTQLLDIPTPGWGEMGEPEDSMSSGGAGPSSAESVSVAAGISQFDSGPDLWAYDPAGPGVSYERMYRSSVAAAGYSSTGLPVGWTDNFDYAIVPQQPGMWGPLTLFYPDGGADTISPGTGLQNNGAQTTLSAPIGAPYTVTGITALSSGNQAFSAVGEWQDIQLTMADQSVWTFRPDPASQFEPYCTLYYLYSIENSLQQTIYINRSGDATVPFELDHITSITDTQLSTLLSFQYNPNTGVLQSVTDNNGRTVSYGYASATDPAGSFNELSTMSVIGNQTLAQWQYGYDTNTGYLQTAQTINPNYQTGTPTYVGYQDQYDTNGRVSSHTDANGNVRGYSYASGGTSIASATPTELANNSNDLAWTQNFGTLNLDTGDTNPSGTTSVVCGDTNNPLSPTQLIDRTRQFSANINYYSFGHINNATPPGGPTSSASYINPQTGQIDSSPGLIDLPNTVTVKNPSGGQIVPTVLTYTQSGLVATATWPQPNSTGASAFETATYTYDHLGNVTQIIEPGPNSTLALPGSYNSTYTTITYTYANPEALGEPFTVTVNGLNSDHTTRTSQSVSYRYDPLGDVTAVIDAIGIETDYQYNAAGQLTQVTEPSVPTGQVNNNQYVLYQPTITYNYGYTGGPLLSRVLSGNNLTEQVNYQYGPEGELKQVSSAATPSVTQSVTYGYDSLYRVTSLTDGNGNTTNYQYDPSGNLQYVIYPDLKKEQYTYDADGTLQTYTDPNGITRTYIRNPNGDQTQPIADPSEVWEVTYSNNVLDPIFYDWDGFERIKDIHSESSGQSTYTLDDLGEPIEDLEKIGSLPTTYSDITYNYNPDGSEATSTFGNYSYDGLGRLTAQQPRQFVNMVVNNSSSATSGTPDTFKYQYLANGWLSEADTFIGGPGQYLDGPYPDGVSHPQLQTTYAYDGRGELTVLANTMWQWNVPNQSANSPVVNTVLSTYGNPYLNLDEYNTNFVDRGLPPIMTHDAAGNRLQELAFINPLANDSSNNGYAQSFNDAFPPNLTGKIIYQHDRTYQYDGLNELHIDNSASSGQQETNSGQTLLVESHNYTGSYLYDPAGNPTTFRNTGSIPFNSNNQITQFGLAGFGYDFNGNTTNFGGAQATYDPEDRLTSIPYAYNGQTYNFGADYYASTGLRQSKTDANGTTYFVYDGDNLVEELDSSGNLVATNVYGPTGLMARYVSAHIPYTDGAYYSGSPSPAIGDLGNAVYYTYDPQGNVVQRLITPSLPFSGQGGVTYTGEFPFEMLPLDTMYFDAFGSKQWDIDLFSGQQEAYQDPFGYGAQWGYYTDQETGLVLMGHRYYAFGNGRFMTRDPIGYAGGLNLYGFVGNNPITGADPIGLSPNNGIFNWLPYLGLLGPQFMNGPGDIGKTLDVLGGGPMPSAIGGLKDLLGGLGGPTVGMMAIRGPKLWPFGPHNQTIQRRINEIQQEHPDWKHIGGGNLKELKIKTPNGLKSFRRPDISFELPDGSIYNEQVGKIDANGDPVPRELKALEDLEHRLGQRPTFTPYNTPKTPIVEP